MCKKLLFLISLILVVAFAGNARAIDISWTDANGIQQLPGGDVDDPNHEWHDPCNWTSVPSMIVPGSGSGVTNDPDGYLNQAVSVQWARYYDKPQASGAIVRDDIGTIAYLKPGTGSSTVVAAMPYRPAVCLFKDGGKLVTSNTGTITDRGNTQIAQSSGTPGTLEMTGGFTDHGRILMGRRALGVIKLWHDDVNDPGGDPCLATTAGGSADIKMGNAQSGTGQARVYILDGTIRTSGLSFFAGEAYMNIERGVLETGGDAIGMPTGGSSGTDAERIEWLYANVNPDPDFRNPEGGQLRYLECYAGSGLLNYEVGPVLPFSSACPYIQDYHPERALAAGWIRVWCLSPEPNFPVLPSPKNYDTEVSKYAKKCPEAVPPPVSLAKKKLVWRPPLNGAAHYEVYLGTDADNVDNGTGGTYMTTVDVNNYTPADLLLSTEYFWRIEPLDAGNNSKGHGYLWTFETSHCLCVDDFESYTGLPAGVWTSITDGIALNSVGGYANAHGGMKSMKIFYSSSLGGTEAYWSPSLLTNWTVGGQANSLSLWYKAKATAESIYVRVTDTANTAVVVDLLAALDDCWHEAIVPYTAFAPVVMTSVKWLDIGVTGLPAVGETALIDDIALCEPRCYPDNTLPGDIDGDCDVDGADLRLMAADWLVNNNDPFNCALMPEPNGPNQPPIFVNDSLTDPNNRGQVIEFDGIDDWGEIPDAPLHDFHDKTISVWAKRIINRAQPDPNNDFTGYMFYGRDASAYRMYLNFTGGTTGVNFFVDGDAGAGLYAPPITYVGTVGTFVYEPNNWNHYVAVVREVECPDRQLARSELYVNGNLIGTRGPFAWHPNHSGLVGSRIGCETTSFSGTASMPQRLHGRMDEFRIYNYALDVNEIRYLKGNTNEPAPDANNLILYYPFNETSGNIAYNSVNPNNFSAITPANKEPAERTDTFHAVINDAGTVTGRPTWYYYPNTDWWNVWFDNRPYTEGKKRIRLVYSLWPTNPANANIAICINAATPAWSALTPNSPPLPPLTSLEEAAYIFRGRPFFSGNVPAMVRQTRNILLQSYNPGWISLDIRGQNVILVGKIWHKCIPPSPKYDTVNIRDYAVLALDWLEKQLTP